MREHWKQRRQAKDDKKRRTEKAKQHARPILPKDATTSSSSTGELSSIGLDGIPTQALTGMNRVLGCGRLDPFDMFPVKLTPQHHKLLHHCELPKAPCCPLCAPPNAMQGSVRTQQ